jgi:putative copper resistance protein D
MPASMDMHGTTAPSGGHAAGGMPVMPGMHGMYAPPVDAHSLLTAWPVDLGAVVVLCLAAWAARRALRMRRATPRSPAWSTWAGGAVGGAALGAWWAVATPHGSPFSYLMFAVEVTAAVFYLTGVGRLAARGRTWPAFRTACFLSGLVVVALALQSPVSTLVASSFEYHVVQHMLLMVVAAPLLALSGPMTLALQTTSHHTKVVLLKILHSRSFGILTFPVTVWFLYYGVMFAFFLTPLIGFAMEHMVVMDVLNLAFLFGACNFWWPTIGIDHNPRWTMNHGMRIINVLIGVPFESFLGIALLGGAAAAPMYTVAQTQTGGGMLWGIGELSAFVGVAIIMVEWLRDDERAAAREDRRTAARQQVERRRQAGSEPGPDRDRVPASAYEEAYLARGIPVPVTLSDDYRG